MSSSNSSPTNSKTESFTYPSRTRPSPTNAAVGAEWRSLRRSVLRTGNSFLTAKRFRSTHLSGTGALTASRTTGYGATGSDGPNGGQGKKSKPQEHMSGLLGSGRLKKQPRIKLSECATVIQNGDSGGQYENGDGGSVDDISALRFSQYNSGIVSRSSSLEVCHVHSRS